LSLAVSGAPSADFAIGSSSCTGTLAAGGSCSLVVIFTPSTAGGRQGFLTASSSTQGVISATTILNGTGLAPPALSTTPPQLGFAATLIGQVSATQIVTVANSGGAGIAGLQLAVSLGFALDPAQTTCTAILNAGASCNAGVLFAPSAAGAVTGALTASFPAAGGSGSIAATTSLTGTGAVPPGILIVPAALVQFGTTGLGQAAQPVPVTVTNPGSLSSLTGFTLAVDATGTANGFALSGNTCGATLAPGASCMANVTFAPPAYGPLTGTLIASSANGGNPVSLQLEGIGFDFRLTVAGSDSVSVVQGQTANYNLALTALGGAAGTSGGIFSFQCANLPANAICVFNPAQLGALPANVTGNVALGIATGAPTAASQRNNRQWRGTALLVCGVLALPLGLRKRKSLRGGLFLLGVVLVGLVGGLSSCAGSGGSSGSGGTGGQSHLGGGTPPGSYVVTVSASASGVVHSSTVTLVVN
jgi:hypothetical protein